MSVGTKLELIADAVYEKGKQAEWSEFWDALQQNGNRTNYSYAFYGESWTDENFKPKYDIKPTIATSLFYGSKIVDLRGIIERQGITMDFSEMTSFSGFLQGSDIQYVGIVNVTGATSSLSNIFRDCKSLKEISELVVVESNSFGVQAFTNCSALYHIRINGVIGSGFYLSSAPLDRDSIVSVVSSLSNTASGKTLSLKKTAVTNAFGSTDSDEWKNLIATKSNWTITLS